MTITATDPRLIERAWIGEHTDGPPGRYIKTVVNLPDGGARTYHSWTAGGEQLGDTIDTLAVGQRRDAYDWVEFFHRHETCVDRGRHYLLVVDLLPLLEDLRLGVPGADADRRAALDQFIAAMTAAGHSHPQAGVPQWVGFGPALLGRRGRATR